MHAWIVYIEDVDEEIKNKPLRLKRVFIEEGMQKMKKI